MQSSAVPVICFSWREIVATRGRAFTNGYSSFANTDHGDRIVERAMGVPTAKNECNKRNRERSILHMGGELSRFKRLHGSIPGSMRFSCR